MKAKREKQLRNAVLKLLYYRGTLSLAELSARTKKSIPLITSVIAQLTTEGIALEDGLAPSTGGRRPATYRLNENAGKHIVAVAMDQFISRIAIYNLLNKPICPEESINLSLQDNPHAFDQLCSAVESHLLTSGVKKADVIGVGIAMPGFIDLETGTNASFLNTGNHSTDLRKQFSARLCMPVFIENDSSAIAVAELHFGAARDLQDVMVVNMGWGIGLGMIVNGSLFRGNNGYAGEFSHIPLSQTDKLCSCGKRGCLEVDASLLVAVENAKAAIADGTSSRLVQLFRDKTRTEGDQLIAAARNGDQLAVSSLSDAAFMVGKGIATLIHIMNPERVVVSGRGSATGKILLPPIQRAINEFCIPKLVQHTDIVVSSLGYEAELLGAASLVIEHGDLDEFNHKQLITYSSFN